MKTKLIIIGIILLCIVGLFFVVKRFDERIDRCIERNGFLIKSVDGWKCANKDILL